MAYLKAFTGLLIVLQLNSAPNSRFVAEKQVASPSTTAGSILQEARFAQLLENSGINLRPGTAHRSDSRPTPAASLKCKSLVYRALLELPPSHKATLEELTLFYTKEGRRGLSGNGAMILRCLNVTDSELVGVFMHEMGHLVDSDFLKGHGHPSEFYDFSEPVALDDPSLEFFRISWLSEKKRTAESTDFVSLYAMSDPFEDFAETYAYYRLHGAEFRTLQESSFALAQKYEFMKEKVFGGEEFGFGVESVDAEKRQYDVTVLPYSLEEFLTNS